MYDSLRDLLKDVHKDFFDLDIPDSKLQSAILTTTTNILHLPKEDVHFKMVYKFQRECPYGRDGEDELRRLWIQEYIRNTYQKGKSTHNNTDTYGIEPNFFETDSHPIERASK